MSLPPPPPAQEESHRDNGQNKAALVLPWLESGTQGPVRAELSVGLSIQLVQVMGAQGCSSATHQRRPGKARVRAGLENTLG